MSEKPQNYPKIRIANTAKHKKSDTNPFVKNGKLYFYSPMKLPVLAKLLKVNETEIIKKLFIKGKIVTINNDLTNELIAEVCFDFDFDFELLEIEEDDDDLFNFSAIKDDPKDLVPRSPVVTIMGHVDHGKTTLIDAIRKSNITATEAGFITQAIGAYQRDVNGYKITFIDTPGHEAFTAMRSRGAKVTDIVILVVAADDGVMPQTKEAIDHARAAKVPIIVAVNKIDKVGVNPDKVKNELLAYNVISEEFGGDVIFQEISAKTGQNLEKLLDAIIATAEMLELKANPNRYAYGTVLEARLDRGEGPKATLLIENGTLTNKDFVVAGCAYGKVRRMTNEYNKMLKVAGPATPVQVIGLSEVPEASDQFMAFETEKEAKEIAEKRKQAKILSERQATGGVKLGEIHKQISDDEIIDVNVIIKADNSGSAEAVKASLEKINVKGVNLNVIRATAGTITESDVLLATASNAVIFGFNVRPTANVRDMAERSGIEIRLHRIIYALLEETEAAMKGLLEPELVEKVTGQAEVRQTWQVSRLGTIAGCRVTSGVVKNGQSCRLLRDGVIIYEGEIATMKHGQIDAKETHKGYECGMTLKNYNDIHEGDVIEGHEMVEVKTDVQ